MSGYPVIYWVVVAIVAGAVSAVLIGIGYLLGLNVAARRVERVRKEMAESWDRLAGLAPKEYTVPRAALPGPRKGQIR